MRPLFAILVILLFVSACSCGTVPPESTEPYEQANNQISDKGVCGDKVCKGKESDPQDKAYCKQDCYPN